MDQPHTPPADRASAPSHAPETASAPTEQPADSAPGPVPSEGSPEQRRRGERPWDRDAYDALVAAGLRAPNMREFTLNSPEAWALFRPEPSLLPNFPLTRHNPVERDG